MAGIEYGKRLVHAALEFHTLHTFANNYGPLDFSFWFYIPNKGASIFFAIAFLVSTVLHYWQSSLALSAPFYVFKSNV